MVGRIIVPTFLQRCSCPNPWNLWICYLMWQKEHWRCDYVEDLEMGRHPGWVRWAWCRHTCPYPREAERDVTREENRWREKVSTVRGGLWRWRQGLTAKEYGRPWGAGKRKETDSPLEPPGGVKACWHLDSSQQNQLQTSDLRDCEILIIHLCCS